MKYYLRIKQDAFALSYLDEHWPEDWDEGEFEAALEDWQDFLDAKLGDALITWKNEREQQKAEHRVEVSRG